MSSTNKVSLSAINPKVVNNIPTYKEDKIRGKEWVGYGSDNLYPNYLWDLYLSVASLQSIINGTVDYICGDDIIIDRKINKKGESPTEFVRKLAIDLMVFGGFAIQVIRNLGGEVAEMYALDFMKVRSDEKNEIFYYSDDWSKWGAKAKVYPKFEVNDTNPTSIYYYKGNITRTVYPTPIYSAALIACELEKSIDQYHLNNISNGFAGNVIINFNNGQPSEKEKEKIEDAIEDKFGGYQNAGRTLISYNDSAENAATIERLAADNSDEKYQSLAKRSREEILQAFRCPEVIIGGSVQSNGFNNLEFESAFKLYNRTVVQPLQKTISTAIEKIFGNVQIVPFTIKWDA